MNKIPRDPYLLLSYINMKLRDEFETPEDFCAANDVRMEEITDILEPAGFRYDAATNQFR